MQHLCNLHIHVLLAFVVRCGFSALDCFNILKFQNFNISTFQHFNILLFQHFNILKISTFQHFNILTFQHFNISTFQHFNISTFQHLKGRFQMINKSEPLKIPKYSALTLYLLGKFKGQKQRPCVYVKKIFNQKIFYKNN